MIVNILVDNKIIGSVDTSMKKVFFTDSSYKDFEFRFVNEFIYFHYIVNNKPVVMELLTYEEIEDNRFPKGLKDFQEALKYLRSYVANIAFS